MLFRTVSRLPLLVLLALLCACSKPSQNAAADPNGEEIDPYQNLTFQFASAVAAPDQQDRWDTVQYVKFEPAVRGKFKWNSDRELVFSPSTPFRPSTTFTARLRPEALPADKRGTTLPEDRAKFHTPYLQMQEPQAFWGRSAQAAGTAEMRVELPFNYSVRPADVQPLLRVTQDGQPVAFEVTGTEPGATVRVALNQQVRPGSPLTVALAQGLRAVGSDQASTADYEKQIQVPDPQALEVRSVAGSLQSADPAITILTNQPVTTAELRSALTVSPTVAFETQELESGFVLKGGFEVGKSYQVSLRQGLRGGLGGQLAEDFTQTVSFSDERPTIQFASADKALYLDALGSRNLGVRINEVAQVKVTIAKVYANNIQQLLRAGTEYGYPEYSEDEGGGEEESEDGEYVDRSYQYYDVENLGNVLSERTYSVAGLGKEQGLRLLNLSLKDLEFTGGLKGLYIVKVQDTERQWLQVSKLVAVSDIGLIVKQGKAGSTLVFANSIRSAKPLGGVAVRFVSTNNQVIGTGTTNGDGVAKFDTTAANGRFKLGLVMAQQGSDFTFLDLSRSRVETSRFEVGGLQSNAARYQAFLYGDRDLYRPGDTIQTNTVVRTEDWQSPAARLPVKIRLLLPTGKEYASLRKELSAAGSFEARFILPPSVMTGLYTLEVLTGNDVLLTSRQVSVEEFIPDRMKVTVKTDRAVAKPGQTIAAQILAQNLFGPPAADRKFEVEFSLKEKTFAPKNYADYSFSLNSGARRRGSYGSLVSAPLADRFENTVREGTTDAAGRGTATYEIPDYTDLGTLEGAAFTTVFDETGRPVNRLATFEVQTQAVLFGIRRQAELVSTGQKLPVQLAALSPAGQPVEATAQVTIVRLLWETVIERQGGRYIYNSQQREQVVLNRTVPVYAGANTDANLGFVPAYSGEYEVRVYRPGASTFVAQRVYAYGDGDTQSNSFEVSNEGEVTIEADKEKYQPGETAQLLLKTPFPGRVL
ncbi:MAG: alpha-2-macroglobulin family protein, partial [Hymenobacter sp.]|nr:alpha-2-macroglobulin family protein [Hymenobacter sp.]